MASSRDAGPELLLQLANLEAVRKPGRGPRVKPEPLASTRTAADALGVERVSDADLVELRELHDVLVELVAALIDGGPFERPARRLAALAAPSQARAGLAVADGGTLGARLEWSDPTLVSGLARRAALEVGAIERARLRRCGRAECDLVFYDTTKSNTRRWHAQSPCGQRERQRRFRAGHAAGQ